MKSLAKHQLCLFIAGCFILTIAINHQSATKQAGTTVKVSSNRYHISHDLQKKITFGYERTLSVLYWFDVISAFGGKNALESDYSELAKRLDTITTLNPYAEHAYLMAAIVLPWELGDTTLSRPLLKKAMQTMPEKWLWPYYYAFNAYWFDHDMNEAAHYMAHAAALADAPPIIIRLASKMQAESNNLDAAIAFLQQTLKNKQQDDSLTEMLRQRIATIQTEKVLRRIEHDLLAVPGWKGDMTRLQELDIDIPYQLPDGGIVIFDKQHHPMSSKQSRRFKIFTPPHHKKKVEKHG